MKKMRWTAALSLLFTMLLGSAPFVTAEPKTVEAEPVESTESLTDTSFETSEPDLASARAVNDQPISSDLESLKKALIDLKRDLVILEEDLLYPASSQLAVFLSMDVGEFFELDAVTLKLNGKEVAHHLYTDRQVDALYRGGIQKLYLGNVKQGENRLTAFFTGLGPGGRDYKRAATVEFVKSFEPTYVELSIADSTAKLQPEFHASVSD